MNHEERFDELTRKLAASTLSRGRMLRLLGGAVLGGALGGWGLTLGAGDAVAKKKKKKKLPTVESLAAARAQIEAGATDVALSPGGYFRYRRAFIGNFVSSEELLEGGKPVLTWEHTQDQFSTIESLGKQDADRDGFIESRTRISYPPQHVDGQWMTIEEYSPKTQALIRRQTYERTGPDTIHVLRECDDGSGNLVKEAEFDTTPVQVLKAEHLAGPGAQAAAEVAALTGTGCTAAQEKDIRDRLDEAMVQGFKCTRDNGVPELGTKVVGLTGRQVIINCVSEPSSDLVAELNWWDGTVGESELEITVNLSKYGGYPLETQRGLLWHEVSHAHFGSHDLFPPARNLETDQTWACQSLCFPASMKAGSRTKCSCARCLGTDKCDKRCKGFANCDADMGSGYSVKCNCPTPKEECDGECMDPCPGGKKRDPSSCQCLACGLLNEPCTGPGDCCGGNVCCGPLNDGTRFCCDDNSPNCFVSSTGHAGACLQ